jgi:hypothetical protein
MAKDHGCPRDQIMAGHSIENFTCIFFAPTLDVHIDKVGAHKNIKLITILHNLCMNAFAFL